MNKQEYIKYLENKINRCDEFGDMKKEKWAFIQALKTARELDCNSERQPATKVSEQHDRKALHIADVVRSLTLISANMLLHYPIKEENENQMKYNERLDSYIKSIAVELKSLSNKLSYL